MAPFFDAVVDLHDHLRCGHRKHGFAEPGHQEQQVDAPVQQRVQARGTGLLIFVVGGYRADASIVEFLDRLQGAELVDRVIAQRAFLQVQVGLRGRLAPPIHRVERVQACVEGVEACRLSAQVNIALEERLEGFIPKPFT